MKIALIAPTGKIGFEIAREALRQGHTVTGIVRTGRPVPEELQGIKFEVADMYDTASFAKSFTGLMFWPVLLASMASTLVNWWVPPNP